MAVQSETALLRLAERQRGLINRRQVRRARVSDSTWERRVSAGRYEQVLPGVFRVVGVAPTTDQRVLAATMWGGAGALAAGTTAGSLLALDRVTSSEIEIAVSFESGRRDRDGVRVRRSRTLGAIDRTNVHGVPCTNAARTIIDLAPRIDEMSLRAAFDSARRTGLLVPSFFLRRVDALTGRGRPGSALLRAIAAEGCRQPPLESVLELRIWELLKRSRLPLPKRQHVVDVGGESFRLDFAWPEHQFSIEGEGWEHHRGIVRWKRDKRRLLVLGSVGWRPVPVTWSDVDEHPDETIAYLEAGFHAAAHSAMSER